VTAFIAMEPAYYSCRGKQGNQALDCDSERAYFSRDDSAQANSGGAHGVRACGLCGGLRADGLFWWGNAVLRDYAMRYSQLATQPGLLQDHAVNASAICPGTFDAWFVLSAGRSFEVANFARNCRRRFLGSR